MRYLAVLLGMFFFFGCGYRTMTFMPQPESYVYIPTGTNQYAFWITESAITNKQYRTYLEAVGLLTTTVQDSMSKKGLWISDYLDYYNEPIFNDFPVVGLTKVEMINYAKWLSAKISKENPPWLYEFRLPTVNEWQYAAKGGRNNNIFPWGGPWDTNSHGCYLLWAFTPKQQTILFGENTSRKDFYTREDIPDSLMKSMYDKVLLSTKNLTKTKRKYLGKCLPMIGLPVIADAYFPNDYGLYNMSGNVAQMTHEGEVVGGSFRLSSDYAKIKDAKKYPFDQAQPQCDIGFRLVCSYQKKNN